MNMISYNPDGNKDTRSENQEIKKYGMLERDIHVQLHIIEDQCRSVDELCEELKDESSGVIQFLDELAQLRLKSEGNRLSFDKSPYARLERVYAMIRDEGGIPSEIYDRGFPLPLDEEYLLTRGAFYQDGGNQKEWEERVNQDSDLQKLKKAFEKSTDL